jgi:hypothetical protein
VLSSSTNKFKFRTFFGLIVAKSVEKNDGFLARFW